MEVVNKEALPLVAVNLEGHFWKQLMQRQLILVPLIWR